MELQAKRVFMVLSAVVENPLQSWILNRLFVSMARSGSLPRFRIATQRRSNKELGYPLQFFKTSEGDVINAHTTRGHFLPMFDPRITRGGQRQRAIL
jgi:hypothetical protein